MSNNKQLYTETCKYLVRINPDMLTEAVNKQEQDGGRLIIRGVPATQLDVENANGRVYAAKDMKEAINNAKNQIKNKRLLSTADDHPPQTHVAPIHASHVIIDAYIKKTPDGNFLFNDWEILETNNGKNLRALIEAGASFGTSIRGLGNMEGKNVINYEFLGTDAVGNPSSGTFAGKTEDLGIEVKVECVCEDANLKESHQGGGIVDPSLLDFQGEYLVADTETGKILAQQFDSSEEAEKFISSQNLEGKAQVVKNNAIDLGALFSKQFTEFNLDTVYENEEELMNKEEKLKESKKALSNAKKRITNLVENKVDVSAITSAIVQEERDLVSDHIMSDEIFSDWKEFKSKTLEQNGALSPDSDTIRNITGNYIVIDNETGDVVADGFESEKSAMEFIKQNDLEDKASVQKNEPSDEEPLSGKSGTEPKKEDTMNVASRKLKSAELISKDLKNKLESAESENKDLSNRLEATETLLRSALDKLHATKKEHNGKTRKEVVENTERLIEDILEETRSQVDAERELAINNATNMLEEAIDEARINYQELYSKYKKQLQATKTIMKHFESMRSVANALAEIVKQSHEDNKKVNESKSYTQRVKDGKNRKKPYKYL